ncbi:ATP-binding protein [Novosphingobium sp. PC22D]|uniref:ATP-binding protein n=1 Tax=Novosphingobium sp. PC22D TaxID=1962403 RepID=UPI00143B2199|nr:ATP-binding protein [Novosphingobium sp. PC22D]
MSRDRIHRDLTLEMRALRHQWANDMQLILAMIESARRECSSAEAAEEVRSILDRLEIIASGWRQGGRNADSLTRSLQNLCAKANALSDTVQVAMTTVGREPVLESNRVIPLTLAVNELVTNAVKHGRRGGAAPVLVLITLESRDDGSALRIAVEDDGSEFGGPSSAMTRGSGLLLVRRLVEAQGGHFHTPGDGSKRFEIHVPVET